MLCWLLVIAMAVTVSESAVIQLVDLPLCEVMDGSVDRSMTDMYVVQPYQNDSCGHINNTSTPVVRCICDCISAIINCPCCQLSMQYFSLPVCIIMPACIISVALFVCSCLCFSYVFSIMIYIVVMYVSKFLKHLVILFSPQYICVWVSSLNWKYYCFQFSWTRNKIGSVYTI